MSEPFWNEQRVAQCLNHPHTERNLGFSAIVTDSRKIVRDSLFVCLRGDRFDGHDFIAQAIAAGATGVVLEVGRWPPGIARASVAVFEVPAPLHVLRQLAGWYREQFTIPLVMVAGSVGKTTTKELLAAGLSAALGKPVHRTAGSENGFLGIALTLLKLEPQHAAAVIEVGIDDIGAMAQHVALLKPDGVLVTAIGPEHLEHLRDIDTVAREECLALDDALARGKPVALQLDEPWIVQRYRAATGCAIVGATLGEVSYAGRVAQGRVTATDDSGSRLRVTLDDKSYELTVPVPGLHNARNGLLAFAMGAALGMEPALLIRGMAEFKAAFGRGEVSRFDNGVVVLRDYYNANPTSVAAALDMLAATARGARWACLGDMLELGANEQAFHESLAEPLTRLRVEHVLLFGARMQWLAQRLGASGFSGQVSHFATHDDMAQALRDGVNAGDRILIKGSRGMRMEEVWKAFRAAYPARELAVR